MNDLGRDDSNQGSPSIHQFIRAVHQSINPSLHQDSPSIHQPPTSFGLAADAIALIGTSLRCARLPPEDHPATVLMVFIP
jgi:hypothetical protein